MALQDDVRNLADLPALRELEPGALKLIAFAAETRILRAGDVLFHRGAPSDGGYVVLSGAVVLTTVDGAATIVRPPALIGASALIAETIRPATAEAHEPSSVLKISRDLFRRVLTEHPDSAVRLRRAIAGQVSVLRQDMRALQARIID